MARKSNKTAHVLNLLAGGPVDNEPPEHQEPELKKKAPSNISLIDPASISDPLSSLIRETLDKEAIQSDDNNVKEEKKEEKTVIPGSEVLPSKQIADQQTDPEASPKPPVSDQPQAEIQESKQADAPGLEDINIDVISASPVIPNLSTEIVDEQTSELVNSIVSAEMENQLTEVIQNQLFDNAASSEEVKITAENGVEVIPETVDPETVKSGAKNLGVEEIEKLVASISAKASEMPDVSDVFSEEIFQTGESTEEVKAEAAPVNITPADKPEEPPAQTPLSSSSDAKELQPSTEAGTEKTVVEPPEPEEEYKYVNMMDIIVEERLMEFMNRFNVCTCKRCVADTKALALNNLPPKYIVAPVTSFSPLLSFYRNKYNIYVITELTKACLVVLDHPRH